MIPRNLKYPLAQTSCTVHFEKVVRAHAGAVTMLRDVWGLLQAQFISLLQHFPVTYPIVAAALHAVLHTAGVPLYTGA